MGKATHCCAGPKSCAQCKWEILALHWQAKLSHMLIAGQRIPWLQKNEDGVGCVACAIAGLSGAYARFAVCQPANMQMAHFWAHEKLESHVQAVQALEHPEKAAQPLTCEAPSLEEFEKLWHHLRKTRVNELTSEAVGFRKKNQLKTHCLAEGVRRIDRA